MTWFVVCKAVCFEFFLFLVLFFTRFYSSFFLSISGYNKKHQLQTDFFSVSTFLYYISYSFGQCTKCEYRALKVRKPKQTILMAIYLAGSCALYIYLVGYLQFTLSDVVQLPFGCRSGGDANRLNADFSMFVF